VIDAVELEGLEYVSAAKWAANNLMGYAFGTGGWYYSFNNYRKNYRKASTILKLNNEIYCYESCLVAYAQGNKAVSQYLSNENFPINRADAVHWFKEGGKFHSFIEDDFEVVQRGDIMFKGSFRSMEGHAAIVNNAPVFSEDGKMFTLEVLSTGTGNDYTFGLKTYTFVKNEQGEWIEQDSGQKLIGFGRIDEEGIKHQQNQMENENNESME
jgi:hypothetical protein